MDELEGGSLATPVIVKEPNNESGLSSTSNLLPTTSVVPKNFLAVFSVTTTEYFPFKTVFGLPYNRGNENILKKPESTNPVPRLKALSVDLTFSITSPPYIRT